MLFCVYDFTCSITYNTYVSCMCILDYSLSSIGKTLIIIVSCTLLAADYFLKQNVVQILKHAKKLKCSDYLNEKILELRKDFSLHDDTKMLVMLSISTNDMNRYVSMYPDVWFIDCTSGESVFSNTYVLICIYQFILLFIELIV